MHGRRKLELSATGSDGQFQQVLVHDSSIHPGPPDQKRVTRIPPPFRAPFTNAPSHRHVKSVGSNRHGSHGRRPGSKAVTSWVTDRTSDPGRASPKDAAMA